MQRSIIEAPKIGGHVSFNLELNARGRAGADSITGAGQVVYGVKPRWEGAVTFHRGGRDDILAWRAVLSKLRGRVNVLRMPLLDPLRPSNADIGLPENSIVPTPHSDGAYFSDGSGYALVPTANVGAAVAVGANSLSYDATVIGDALQPGQFFSVDDWPYRVTSIAGSGANTTIEFEPPAFVAMPANSIMRLDARSQWVLPTDMAALPSLDRIKYSLVELPMLQHVNL